MMLKVLQRREDAEVEKVDTSWEKINKNKCSFGVARYYLLMRVCPLLTFRERCGYLQQLMAYAEERNYYGNYSMENNTNTTGLMR